MTKLSDGIFKVDDGEVITIKVTSTGETLFGVNYSIFGNGAPIPEESRTGTPPADQGVGTAKVTMDKSKATVNSKIEGAKATPLTLLFSFTSKEGSAYGVTLTGADGVEMDGGSTKQAGGTPKAITYIFHIVSSTSPV